MRSNWNPPVLMLKNRNSCICVYKVDTQNWSLHLLTHLTDRNISEITVWEDRLVTLTPSFTHGVDKESLLRVQTLGTRPEEYSQVVMRVPFEIDTV